MNPARSAPHGYRGRFAPSPTGDLHFGSLTSAVGSWLRARSQGGEWIVRMEDLDPPREVAGSAARILSALQAFGLESDQKVVYQSQRRELYADALRRLQDDGAAFPCRCSRAQLGPGGLHRSVCAAPADNDRIPAWRVMAPDLEIAFDDLRLGRQTQNLAAEVGDFVVKRVEGFFAYQLAVVVDDAAQGITEIVRGADLLDSTARQIYLQRLLGFATPRYLHLPLAVDASGSKLSKQLASRPVDPADPLPALRAALEFLGQPASAVRSAGSVDQLLAAALQDFDIRSIPSAAQIRVD